MEEFGLKTWLYTAGNVQYLLINAAIGVGIAADAVIATIGRFKRFETVRDALTWAAAIGFTHTVFPMIGLIGLWYAASSFPSLKAAIYGAGFLAMVWFINDVVRDIAGLDGEDDRGDGGRRRGKRFLLSVFVEALPILGSGLGGIH